MGIFDRFKKKEEEIVENDSKPIDSKLVEFSNICIDIEDNFIPETVHKEDHLQAQLFQWLSARYDYLKISRESPFGMGNRADILINDRFAFELKLVDQRTKLRDLLGQLKEYCDNFDYVCAVLFFTEQKIFNESQTYVEEYDRLFGVRSILLSGKRRGYQSKNKPDITRDTHNHRPSQKTSTKYSKPKEKKKSLADKVVKGFKVAGEVMDALSPEPPKSSSKRTRKTRKKPSTKKTSRPKSKKTKQTRKKEDPFGLDKVADSMKFDAERFFGSSKKANRKDDDPFGMGSIDDFFGDSSKKKRRKKSDDDWSFGL